MFCSDNILIKSKVKERARNGIIRTLGGIIVLFFITRLPIIITSVILIYGDLSNNMDFLYHRTRILKLVMIPSLLTGILNVVIEMFLKFY